MSETFRTSNAADLIGLRYLALLRPNDYPHLSIAPGCEANAYTYLKALLHLSDHRALPDDWKPSNQFKESLHEAKQINLNMRSVVDPLIDRFT